MNDGALLLVYTTLPVPNLQALYEPPGRFELQPLRAVRFAGAPHLPGETDGLAERPRLELGRALALPGFQPGAHRPTWLTSPERKTRGSNSHGLSPQLLSRQRPVVQLGLIFLGGDGESRTLTGLLP